MALPPKIDQREYDKFVTDADGNVAVRTNATLEVGDIGIDVETPRLAMQLDDTSEANITYIGYAEIATATSSASWRMKKLDESSGLSITWADGNDNFDNVWDNRTSLSYS